MTSCDVLDLLEAVFYIKRSIEYEVRLHWPCWHVLAFDAKYIYVEMYVYILKAKGYGFHN